MSIAKKCDRCHKLYEQYPNTDNAYSRSMVNGIATTSINIDRGYYVCNLLDLCPDCLKELKHMLDKFIDKPEDSFIQTEFNEEVNTDDIKIIDSDDVEDDSDVLVKNNEDCNVEIVINHPNMKKGDTKDGK